MTMDILLKQNEIYENEKAPRFVCLVAGVSLFIYVMESISIQDYIKEDELKYVKKELSEIKRRTNVFYVNVKSINYEVYNLAVECLRYLQEKTSFIEQVNLIYGDVCDIFKRYNVERDSFGIMATLAMALLDRVRSFVEEGGFKRLYPKQIAESYRAISEKTFSDISAEAAREFEKHCDEVSEQMVENINKLDTICYNGSKYSLIEQKILSLKK